MQPTQIPSESAASLPSDCQLQEHPKHVLAELLCSDEMIADKNWDGDGNEDDEVKSHFDTVLLSHDLALYRLKALENTTKVDYKESKEILPYMRKVVAGWMLEVCEEQGCDEAVFPLAVAILDRLLLTLLVNKEQLQLIACVCLLISSKSRQCSHFSLELLEWYTDGSVAISVIRAWELAILSHLNWDINIITPIDFVDVLLYRCRPGYHVNKEYQVVRRHAVTFIALCSTEPRFVNLAPSLISAAAICTALKGLQLKTPEIVRTLVLHSKQTEELLDSTTTLIENVISTEMAAIQQTIEVPIKMCGGKLSSATASGTPTDVQEIFV